jgi:hypothetical protein
MWMGGRTHSMDIGSASRVLIWEHPLQIRHGYGIQKGQFVALLNALLDDAETKMCLNSPWTARNSRILKTRTAISLMVLLQRLFPEMQRCHPTIWSPPQITSRGS